MNVSLRGTAAWLPVLIVACGLSACGGGGGGGAAPAASSGGASGPPAPPAVPAPSALSYSSPQVYEVGAAIAPLEPTVTGTVTSYGVTPTLPAGLTFDSATGRIAGTPTAPARGTYTVTAANAGGSTTFALAISVLGERSTSDRPDEKTGHQVHVIYVLPSDGIDEHLDRTGTLETSLAIANEWFKTQTGGAGLRFDTYGGGKLDVTFLQVPRTDAQMNVAGGNVRAKLEYQLLAHGFDAPDKAYLVFYGGDGDGCGRGAWPPALPGNVGALYVGAAANCTTRPFALEGEPPGFLEFLAVHETLHVLGFAAACAPNHSETGHVTDSVQDVMYSGQGSASGAWRPSTLDVNHDDYYGSASPGCRDLSNSAFLDPLPAGAEPPPGWPYANLPDLVCANEQTMARDPAGAETQLWLVNRAVRNDVPATVALYESVFNSATGLYDRVFRTAVPVDDGIAWNTTENTVYVVTVNGRCAYLVRAGANVGRFVVE